jgi:hypothetical protein
MKKIVVSQFLTVDGVMEAPEKWNREYLNDAEVVHEILTDFAASDTLFPYSLVTIGLSKQ